MARTITLSVVVALLLGSVASAQIGNIGPQTQAWNLGLNSNVSLLSGTGSASNLASLLMVDAQYANTSEGVTAFQGFGGLLVQGATATNAGPAIGAIQTGSIIGGQSQAFSAYGGPAGQVENVTVAAGQTLVKDENGTGSVQAGSGVASATLQAGGNDCTTLAQGSFVLGGALSYLAGDTCASAGVVGSSLVATVTQQQVANCDVVICPVEPEPVEP